MSAEHSVGLLSILKYRPIENQNAESAQPTANINTNIHWEAISISAQH